MPLILLSGYPSSGKSYRARQLVALLQKKVEQSTVSKGPAASAALTIPVISDQSLGISRLVYGDGKAKEEKDARAKEMSAIKRMLSQNSIVIVDCLNYIKGYRYQIYCESKAARTTSCVIHIGTAVEICREQNARLLLEGQDGYPPQIFESLIMRYEEPNGMTRWDSPLFTIVHSDPEPPFEEIWNTLMGDEGQGLIVRPNPSTLAPAPTTASYLAELSKLTQQVLDVIVQQQADRGAGCEVIVSKTASLKLQLPISQVNAGQLQRIRRQFINMNRSHILEMERLEDIFVEYLSKALGTNES